MKKLIKISNHTISDETIQTVNARDLHDFLEVETRFNDWIKRRIEEYGFIEGTDFILLKNEYRKNQQLTNWKNPIEYFLTLDMAKELAMVERNEKGKEARLYFIQCEKYVKQPNLLEGKAKAAVILIESVTKALNLAQSSTLGLYRSLQDQLGFSGLLPDYTIDASDKNAISSDVHHSLSHLLKEHGIKLSAKAVYVALDEKGITCWQTRKRSNGTTKKFRSVANPKYGINLVSEHNKCETQPHFFDHHFNELMSEIGVR